MSSFVRTGMALAAIGALIVSVGAAAQYPGGEPGGGRGGKGGFGGRGNAADRSADHPSLALADVVHTRLDDLREDLKLAPAQRAAWSAYADKVLRLLADVTRTDRDPMREQMSAPQRLDRLSDIARDRATAIEDVADAGKALYAVLTPEQRVIADAKLAIAVLPLTGNGAQVFDRRGATSAGAPRSR